MRKFLVGMGLVVAVVVLLVPQVGWAQGSGSTGQINGSAVDADGGAMPGATVVATNVDTGFSRTAITDTAGFYRLDLLPSGVYDVKAALDGFRTEIQKTVRVSLGSAVRIDYVLAESAISEEIVVTAEAPVIETTNPSVAATVGDEQIQNLPLQGRDFTDFAILTPGTFFAGSDQAGSRGGMNSGARAVQNSFNIDGADAQSSFFGEERGGTRPPFTFSQAAIKEFQVIKSPYNLQFNASGAVLNAITKSGTNEIRGQVFGYYTDDGMRSADARGIEGNTFEQKQYGFAIGGPIVKDKLHFFVSYDGQRYNTPKATLYRDFPSERIAEWEAITGLNFNNETGGQYLNDDGEWEYGEHTQTNDADVMLLKLDWQLSDNHLMTIRDNYSTQEGQNLTSGYANTGLSNNGLEENTFNSLVVSLNSVFSENAFNELIVQYSGEERPRFANSNTLPETGIYPYAADWGQQDYLPNSLDEDRLQIADNLTYYMGAHTLKTGIDVDMATFKNVFYRYQNGQYSYSSYDDFFNDEPYYYRQSFSDYDGNIEFDVDYYAFYIQDEWRTSPNFTLTYGIRYDLQDNPTPEVCNPAYPDTCQIPDDTNNWAPRVGFAWDMNGDGKSVLKGGAGYFYDNTPTLLLSNAMSNNGVRMVTIQNYCNWDYCPAYSDAPVNSLDDLGDSPTPSIMLVSPDFENPETLRLSLGYEKEVMTDLALGIDLIYSESKKLERSQNQNIEQIEGTTVDGLPLYEEGELYPEFRDVAQYTSDVDAEYKAVILKARKRYSHGWMLDASYTWSEAKDSNSNERSTTSYPFDQYHLDLSWGPSNFDATHKFVLSSTYELPYGFLISGIVIIRSGFPYTAMDGRDTNGDGESGNEYALIELEGGQYFRHERNSFRQPYYRNLDLRLAKSFSLGKRMEIELMFDMFNVTNEANWYTTNTDLVNRYGEIEDDFGELDVPGDPRSYQLGARFRF